MATDFHKWKIVFDSPSAMSGQIFIDDKKLNGVVSVSFNASVRNEHQVKIVFEVIPGTLELEGISTKDNPILILKDKEN